MIVGGFLLTCVWINIDDLFLLIPNSEVYVEGKYVVLFIGMAVLFDMATGVNNEIILMSDFYKWNMFIMFFLIAVGIINNLILIPIYGITGAAMATAISIFLFNVVKYIIVYAKLGIQPFRKKTITALLVGTIVYLTASFLPSTENAILNIIYKGSFISVAYLLSHHYLKTSEDLSKLSTQMTNILKKIVNK